MLFLRGKGAEGAASEKSCGRTGAEGTQFKQAETAGRGQKGFHPREHVGQVACGGGSLEGVDAGRLVLASEALLVARAILGNVLRVLLAQLHNSLLNGLHNIQARGQGKETAT